VYCKHEPETFGARGPSGAATGELQLITFADRLVAGPAAHSARYAWPLDSGGIRIGGGGVAGQPRDFMKAGASPLLDWWGVERTTDHSLAKFVRRPHPRRSTILERIRMVSLWNIE